MANFCCASVHQQPRLLQMRSTLMGTVEGISGTQMQQQQQQRLCFSLGYPAQAAASIQGGCFSSMSKPGRLVAGAVLRERVRRKRVPVYCHAAPEVAAGNRNARCRSAEGSRMLGFTPGQAGPVQGGEDEESAVSINATAEDEEEGRGSPWALEMDNCLFRGQFERYAFLASLLLGAGVGCLIHTGDAEAATSRLGIIHGGGDGGGGGLDLSTDIRALALGPDGPLVEEFWENMRRYGLYFLTVVSGGAYSLARPAIDAFKNPVTAILVAVIITGSIYLVGLTVSAMLGISQPFQYDYAV